MILEHTNQGMRVFPSAMVAALVLQSPEGVAMSEAAVGTNIRVH